MGTRGWACLALLPLLLAGCAAGEKRAVDNDSIEGQGNQLMLARPFVDKRVTRNRCRQLMDLATGRPLATLKERRKQLLSVEYRDEDRLPVKAFFFQGEKPKRVVAVVTCQGSSRSIYRLWMQGGGSLEELVQLLMLKPPDFENRVGRRYCHMLMGQAKSKWMWDNRTQPEWIAYGPDGEATVGVMFKKDEPDKVAAVVACDGPNRSIYRYWTW